MDISTQKQYLGASEELISKLGNITDRMSINIELPSKESLKLLAPDKEKTNILTPMKNISKKIAITKIEKSKYADRFVPARTNYTNDYWSNT